MGERFAGRMWTEHSALNDFGNWTAPLALGVAFETSNWGFAPVWYEPGLWPLSLSDGGWTTPMRAETVQTAVPALKRRILMRSLRDCSHSSVEGL